MATIHQFGPYVVASTPGLMPGDEWPRHFGPWPQFENASVVITAHANRRDYGNLILSVPRIATRITRSGEHYIEYTVRNDSDFPVQAFYTWLTVIIQ